MPKNKQNPDHKCFGVETAFTFTGTFRVFAENEEQARQMVNDKCNMSFREVWTEIPPDEIGWDFSILPETNIMKVTENAVDPFEVSEPTAKMEKEKKRKHKDRTVACRCQGIR